MAFLQESLKLDWLFRTVGGVEQADTGLRITGSSPSFSAASALTALTTGNLTTLFTAMESLKTTIIAPAPPANVTTTCGTQLHAIKASARGVDDTYLGDAMVYQPATAVTWGNIVNATPPQSSVAVTLWSGFTLGGGNYGRMYIPYTCLSIGSDGNGSLASQTTMLNASKTFLDAVNAVFASGFGTGAAISILSNSVATPGSRKVTKVRVGRVTDTQRRRRRNLPESPTLATLA